MPSVRVITMVWTAVARRARVAESTMNRQRIPRRSGAMISPFRILAGEQQPRAGQQLTVIVEWPERRRTSVELVATEGMEMVCPGAER